jgi:hypothetical protein
MIARQLTPVRRTILANDIVTLSNAPVARVFAHWHRYYTMAKASARLADVAKSEISRRRHLSEAAISLALAIAARRR